MQVISTILFALYASTPCLALALPQDGISAVSEQISPRATPEQPQPPPSPPNDTTDNYDDFDVDKILEDRAASGDVPASGSDNIARSVDLLPFSFLDNLKSVPRRVKNKIMKDWHLNVGGCRIVQCAAVVSPTVFLCVAAAINRADRFLPYFCFGSVRTSTMPQPLPDTTVPAGGKSGT